jgi:bacillithiol biosynthesis cysteine-adding enzyme BshC
LTLRVISTPLGGKDLTAAALAGSAPGDWYVAAPRGAEEWRARAHDVSSALVTRDWLSPLVPALEPTGAAADRLRKAADGGFVVTAGQQPALFGGPLYTWWKALSILAFANALEKSTGLPVAPVFWAATDDSDFAEAASTVVATVEGARKISLDHRDDAGLPLSLVPLGDVRQQLSELRDAAGSAPHSTILDVVARTYSPEETVGSSFINLLREVLAPLGVSVLVSSHAAVRKQGEPVMQRALEQAGGVEAALLERDAQLKAAGYSSQVQTVRGRTLVFSASDGRRSRVPMSHASDAASNGAELSPNVLLRPILERNILPTVAYLGGPAEIAYFAQATAVAGALGYDAPLILPRWSGMVIEPRIERILEKYSLTPADFADPHAVETRIAAESLPEPVKAQIAELRSIADKHVGNLASANSDGLVSDRVVEGLRYNILHRVERLERRYIAAVKRKGNDALRDIAAARGALYPFGKPQERILNIVPLLARYGSDLIEQALSEAALHAAKLL